MPTPEPKTAKGARDELTELVIRYQHSPDDRNLLKNILTHHSLNGARASIFRICRKDSEDVTQEFYIQICRAILKFNAGGPSFVAWACGVARHVALNWNRETKKNPVYTDHIDENSLRTEEDGFSYLQRSRLREDILKVLEKTENSDLVSRYLILDFTQDEIAQEMGLPTPTVQYRLRSAQQKLGERLKTLRDCDDHDR